MLRKWLMVLFVIVSISASAQKITGFKDADAAQEIQWEKKLDSLVTPANLDTWMQFLSARPHHGIR